MRQFLGRVATSESRPPCRQAIETTVVVRNVARTKALTALITRSIGREGWRNSSLASPANDVARKWRESSPFMAKVVACRGLEESSEIVVCRR